MLAPRFAEYDAVPQALVTIRYVRRWYADDSRDVNTIPRAVWDALSPEQQRVLRFPVATSWPPTRRLLTS
jgi:hypothetical protein